MSGLLLPNIVSDQTDDAEDINLTEDEDMEDEEQARQIARAIEIVEGDDDQVCYNINS